MRVVLESVERQTGIRPPGLNGPDLPPDAAHIWAWFISLSAARGSNGWGPNPISFPDMAAWADLTGTIIRPSEIEAIQDLDQLWLAQQAKAAEAARKAREQS